MQYEMTQIVGKIRENQGKRPNSEANLAGSPRYDLHAQEGQG